ncbi:hypothetical protein L211DRAFT_849785 [Terfezia boudieri ATCC MYA-4762]|uniref:Uncharacterized protein n=1 Tax=Terfezia boudieri ATCC MYA-4762 TaxID=1051890 RepID=A0A3N4LKT6_9PEZI|nr:hypothetical protein L211DRAFT_849785 [Terfezia boudieri ATCC MYA-4762]
MAWANDLEVLDSIEIEGQELKENLLTIIFSLSGREKERKEGREELNKSKHTVPELSTEQVEQMAKEKVERVYNGAEEDKIAEDDKNIDEEEGQEEVRGRKWSPIWDSRELKTILVCIMNNNKVVEQIGSLSPKKRSFRLVGDADIVNDLIKANREVIEGNWWLDADESGKEGWKALSVAAIE